MTNGKKDILIITGRYLPGYKDGGPVRSIKNLTDYLGNEYNFKILTCDRDHGDIEPYSNIKVNDWNRVGKSEVYYVPPKGFTFNVILKLVDQVDVVYMCGCFNDYAINTLILNRIGKIRKPVVVASMGLFSPLEFKLKYKKKKLFTTIFNVLGMFKNIYWSATSEMEINEIKKVIWAKDEQFFIAEDLPRMVDSTPIYKEKNIGELSVVWISRITPKKNLIEAIRILEHIKFNVKFIIYGSIHSKEYWNECQSELKKLPKNISWEYRGMLDAEKVIDTIKMQNVFLFPTLGENYGHVIQEALSAGCACILSDQTPWQNLEQYNVGFVYKLTETNKFIEAINYYASMDAKQMNVIANNAMNYSKEVVMKKAENTGYRDIFSLTT